MVEVYRFRQRCDVCCHVDEYGSEKHDVVRVLLSVENTLHVVRCLEHMGS